MIQTLPEASSLPVAPTASREYCLASGRILNAIHAHLIGTAAHICHALELIVIFPDIIKEKGSAAFSAEQVKIPGARRVHVTAPVRASGLPGVPGGTGFVQMLLKLPK